jgi:hypothetical protein
MTLDPISLQVSFTAEPCSIKSKETTILVWISQVF